MIEYPEVQYVLDDAADLIMKKGWIQGKMESPAGFCAMGALRAVSERIEPENKDKRDNLFARACQRLRSKFAYQTGIMSWNDEERQTAENVIRMLRGR